MTALVAATDLSYMAGDDVQLEFTVTDEDAAAVNIAGMTIRATIARDTAQTPVISTEASPATATATITAAASGQFQVEVAGEDTADLSGDYVFNVEIEDSNGAVSTVSRGDISFTKKVRKT